MFACFKKSGKGEEDSDAVCASAKSADDGSKRPPAIDGLRKPRNVFFCLLFIVYWILMVGIAVVAFAYGDGRRLIFASDYQGNTCGRNGRGASIYYPQELLYNKLYALSSSGSANDVDMMGVCVTSCPKVGSFVCTYDAQDSLASNFSTQADINDYLSGCVAASQADNQGIANLFGMQGDSMSRECKDYLHDCFLVLEPQVNVFFRCVSNPVLRTETAYTCAYPRWQDSSNKTIKMPARVCSDQVGAEGYFDEACDADACKMRSPGSTCEVNDLCMQLERIETIHSIPSASDGILSNQLASWTMTLYRLLGDVTHTWQSILVTAVLGALVISTLWMCMLRNEAFISFFVYTAVVLGFAALVLTTLLCFTKAGVLSTDWLPGEKVETLYGVLNVLSGSDATPGLWKFFGVVGCLACLAYLLILVAWRRRIKFAVEILQEAARVVATTVSLPLFQLYMTLWIAVLFLWFIGVFSYIVTSGDLKSKNVTFSSLADALQVQASSFRSERRVLLSANITDAAADAVTSTLMNGVATTAMQAAFDATLSKVQSFGTVPVMLVAHFWGCLWTFYVLKCAAMATVAFVACKWYWTRDKSDVPATNVLRAHRTVLCSYFGSIVLGALLLALIMLLRLIINYLYKKTKKLKENNRIILCVLICIQGCISWLYRIIKYITLEAFAVMCMFGSGYCESMKSAYKVLKDNLGRIGALNFICFLITNLSKCVIMSTCVYFEHLWLSRSEQFSPGGEKEIQSELLSLVLAGVASFSIATAFMACFDITANALLMCVCYDIRLNKESGKYYMSKDLRRLVSRTSKVKRRKKKTAKVQAVDIKQTQ